MAGGVQVQRRAAGSIPAFAAAGGAVSLGAPIHVEYLDGAIIEQGYDTVSENGPGRWVAVAEWSHAGRTFSLVDTWSAGAALTEGVFDRRLAVSPATGADPADLGLRWVLTWDLPDADWRFFAPAMVYSPGQYADGTPRVFSDHRLAFPLVGAVAGNTVVTLRRRGLARHDNAPERVAGVSRFLHDTGIGAMGFSPVPGALHAEFPYGEHERSAMLDAQGTPVAAFAPIGPDAQEFNVSYVVSVSATDGFAAAVADSYAAAHGAETPATPALPFTLRDSIDLRLDSLAKTYVEWDGGGAGFVLNFDPERGYASQAKAFGASFADHGMDGSRDILEFGFTGRQLNAAYMLAQRDWAGWAERSRRVADFFVASMTTESGWVYTLWSLAKRRPLFGCGDPDGPVMHYLGTSPVPGAYTRIMVEAVTDLLLLATLHGERDVDDPSRGNAEAWLAAVRRFADFLVGQQGQDGSWFRAYAPTGEPLRNGDWFGDTEAEGKASTAVAVPFLLMLARHLGDDGAAYIEAARRAGDYVLASSVATDEYRGGTLDNPNLVDKEAAEIAMRALLHLYDATSDERYLAGSLRAGRLAVTWHSIWPVPLVPGTTLAKAGVSSVGWGGINSVWGAGVTDIYSLFFLADFVRLGSLAGEPIFGQVAELAAHGCQQLLAHPADLFHLADAGMQPEGISFCSQGVDDGLIAKGDTWGGLGWMYTAGTYGLSDYLDAVDRLHRSTAS